jgi:chorismate dehydratase
VNSPQEIPKLRLAPPETPEELAHRFEREQRPGQVQRAANLDHSLAPFRVGSVPYLNAVPLTRGLEDQILFVAPSKLAEMLQRDELDAALVSVTEVLFHNRYEVLDGIAIASLGEVQSVLLAHRRPLEQITEVFCDPASLASVWLLRVLLAERGLQPEIQSLAGYDPATLPDAAMLIGDPALNFLLGPHEHEVWDLGAAWYDLTGLPFVYAVWALRRGINHEPLRRQLREARDFGMDTLDYIVSSRPEYDYAFRKDYLGWHIHYHLGADEKRGLAKFMELLRKHNLATVHEPRFVS